MGGLTPANSVVDALGAVCTRVLRSVKVIGDDIPAGITWLTKVRKPVTYTILQNHRPHIYCYRLTDGCNLFELLLVVTSYFAVVFSGRIIVTQLFDAADARDS